MTSAEAKRILATIENFDSLTYELRKQLVIDFHKNMFDNEIPGLEEVIKQNHYHKNCLKFQSIVDDFTYVDEAVFLEWLEDTI